MIFLGFLQSGKVAEFRQINLQLNEEVVEAQLIEGKKQVFPVDGFPAILPALLLSLLRKHTFTGNENNELRHAVLDKFFSLFGNFHVVRHRRFHDAGDVGYGQKPVFHYNPPHRTSLYTLYCLAIKYIFS